jgi:DNA-binding beta-propeller fold protein YncE
LRGRNGIGAIFSQAVGPTKLAVVCTTQAEHNRAFVANLGPGPVSVIDPKEKRLLATMPTGKGV